MYHRIDDIVFCPWWQQGLFIFGCASIIAVVVVFFVLRHDEQQRRDDMAKRTDANAYEAAHNTEKLLRRTKKAKRKK